MDNAYYHVKSPGLNHGLDFVQERECKIQKKSAVAVPRGNYYKKKYTAKTCAYTQLNRRGSRSLAD